MKPVTQETITKVMCAMNEYIDHLNKCTKLTIEDQLPIVRKYGISTAVFYDAVACGYFTKIDRGYYKPNIIRFHPIDARTLHKKTLKNKHHNHKGDKFISSHRPKKRVQVINKIVQQEIEKSKKAVRVKNKEFSFFWGLIKINY